MTIRSAFIAAFLTIAVVFGGSPARAVDVTVNTGLKYQQMLGWSTVINVPNGTPDWLRLQIYDELIDQLGLSAIDLTPPISWEDPGNDDADPTTINWSKFDTAGLDRMLLEKIAPFQQRVEARGEPFVIHHRGIGGNQNSYLYDSAESAEWAAALCYRIKQTLGVAPTYIAISNEPDIGHQVDPSSGLSEYTPEIMADRIKTLGPKLKALGLSTTIRYPECMKPGETTPPAPAPYGAWQWVSELDAQNPECWPYIGAISWHEYGNGSSGRIQLFNVAQSRGLTTVQTETGPGFGSLYENLVKGGVSDWTRFGCQMTVRTNPSLGGYTMGTSGVNSEFWDFRQVMHYVRPGAVRVGASTSLSYIRPVAFIKNGKVTTILVNTTGGGAMNVTVKNLPAGQYGVSEAVNTAVPSYELGIKTVAPGGSITVPVSVNGVLTVYPYAGPSAPDFTVVTSTPDVLVAPAPSTTVTLSAAATDKELNPITYSWLQKSGPATQITSANQATATVKNFTTPGAYIFTVTASDGSATSKRDLYVTVASAPAITSQLTATARVGERFIYGITGDNAPTSFDATGLPISLNVNVGTPGTIVGTPTTTGTYNITISATNAVGTGTATLALTVIPARPAVAPAITSPTVALGKVGVPFSYTICACNLPTSFGATALPAWLNLNPTTGVLTGTPTAAGTFVVTARATNAVGTGSRTVTIAIGVPKVVEVTPANGSAAGGTSVTITGTNFKSGASVSFGGAAAASVVVVDANHITCRTPAHAAGAVAVTVTVGGQSASLANGYTFGGTIAAPTLTTVSPLNGTTAGGAGVTINGTNFAGGASVTFGGSAATSVVVVNASTITCATPAHAAGTVAVTVTVGGQSATLGNAYTFVTPSVLAPTVSAVAPSSGTTAGGIPVTITGSNYAAGATVTFGGVAATGVTVVNATTITCTTPAHAVGPVAVVVTVGAQSGSKSSAYTFVAPTTAPTVSAISPTSGSTAGGTAVTISGTDFAAGATVTIGGTVATGVTVVSATTITCTTPAHAAGIVGVKVTVGSQSGTKSSSYTYQASTSAPTVSAINPTSGSTAGGTTVTISGSNFVAGATVTIGGTAATGVTVISATTITCITSAHAAGTVGVKVTIAGQSGTKSSAYTYVVPAPKVNEVNPSTGTTAGGTVVKVTGANFVAGATVDFGGIAATGVIVNGPNSITCTTPAHATGIVAVSVTVGGQTGTHANRYTYVAPTVLEMSARGVASPADAGNSGSSACGLGNGASAALLLMLAMVRLLFVRSGRGE
jgi:hypothetical protein